MNNDRPYYQDTGRRPFLFYVVFGADGTTTSVSREKHKVTEVPQGLDMFIVQRPRDNEYMDAMLGGSLADVLRRSYGKLFDAAKAAEKWTVIRGEIADDHSLDYLRNTIGIIQAVSENGAAAVLDLQTFSLFSPEQWKQQFFSAEPDPFSHAVILISETDGGLWLHTRGMRKFGRPDISIENVPAEYAEAAAQIINQMIFYGAQGVFFDRAAKLHAHNGTTCMVHPYFINDPDDPDFNNCHYRLLWDECEITTET